jgi:hypothetical protein
VGSCYMLVSHYTEPLISTRGLTHVQQLLVLSPRFYSSVLHIYRTLNSIFVYICNNNFCFGLYELLEFAHSIAH